MRPAPARALAALALAALAAPALAAPALAAPALAADGRIVGVQSKDGKIDVIFQARNLPEGQELDPARVTLSVNGRRLNATARPLGGAAAIAVRRATILTIDVSDSMQDAKLVNAKRAAERFLKVAPQDVQIGVVSFGDKPTLLVKPTTDRRKAITAVRDLSLSGNTALYDAVAESVQALGRDGVRSIVLLSDGEDTVKPKALPQVVQLVRRSGVVLDVVAIEAQKALPALRQLTTAGRGRLVEARGVSDLVGLFRDKARDLDRQLLVSAALPAGTQSGSASISVTARAGTQTLTATAEALLGGVAAPRGEIAAGPVPAPVGGGLISAPLTAVFALLMLFVGLATILALGFTSVAGALSDGFIGRRLSVYTVAARQVSPGPGPATGIAQHTVARSAVHLVDRMVAKRGIEERLHRRLDAGGIRLMPAEWILIHGGVAILLPAFLLLLSGGSFVWAGLGLVIGLLVPYVYLRIRDGRRKRRFLEQLPDTLQLLAGSLEAGYSLAQAVDAVSRESEDPLSTEFNRAIVEARLGVPVDDALDSVAHRMQCRDFSWVVMAVRIQREVGGNLAEILKTVAATLRERERLRRQVHALSAEGRLSAWILGGLPVAFAGYLVLVRRDYVDALVTTLPGLFLTALGVLLMIVGIVWMRRIVDVEV